MRKIIRILLEQVVYGAIVLGLMAVGWAVTVSGLWALGVL